MTDETSPTDVIQTSRTVFTPKAEA